MSGERCERAEESECPGHRDPQRAPAGAEAAGQAGRSLGVVYHRPGPGTENRQGHGGVGDLVTERTLLRLHRLQAGLLRVDLVLHVEQVIDRARVRQQGAKLGDGRLVRGDLAVHVRYLLGDVLGLLLQGQLRAQAAFELAEGGLVGRDGNLELDAGGGLGRVVRVGRGRLVRDITACLPGNLGGPDGGRVHAGRPDAQLRGVDDRAGGGQPGRRGGRAAGLVRRAARGPGPAAAFAGAGTAACPDAAFAGPAELADMLEVPAEQPASPAAPASMTLPIMRPARAPCRVRPVRVRIRAELAVFSMRV